MSYETQKPSETIGKNPEAENTIFSLRLPREQAEKIVSKFLQETLVSTEKWCCEKAKELLSQLENAQNTNANPDTDQ